MKRIRYVSVCVMLLIACAAHADFSGIVVGVLDGDTVDVLVDRKPVRVRLAEIDAPEKAQPFGTKSRQALASSVFQQMVTVTTTGTDRYGRTIGTLWLKDRNINKMMVAEGMAWAYRKYLSDQSLLAAEATARRDGVGLWTDPHAVPPWEWRAAKRQRQ